MYGSLVFLSKGSPYIPAFQFYNPNALKYYPNLILASKKGSSLKKRLWDNLYWDWYQKLWGWKCFL